MALHGWSAAVTGLVQAPASRIRDSAPLSPRQSLLYVNEFVRLYRGGDFEMSGERERCRVR